MAERALLLMLAALHRLPQQHLPMDSGTHNTQSFRTNCPQGTLSAFAGLGHIGKAVAHLLQPFYGRLLAYDPYPDAGAELDVYESEGNAAMPVGHPFGMQNVVRTARTVGNAHETFAHMMNMSVEAVQCWLSDEPIFDSLNPAYKNAPCAK